MLLFLPLAVSEVIRHSTFDVGPFAVEVAFRLEDRASDQGIEPPTHLGHAAFEVERPEFNAEFFDQQLAEICLDFVVSGTRRQVAEQVKRCG
ncbi:MAG TPA: hypothetical protein VNF99_00535 [Stellaceae bacterium]|nr:hypothetical protein [Stellaceae bacterium]